MPQRVRVGGQVSPGGECASAVLSVGVKYLYPKLLPHQGRQLNITLTVFEEIMFTDQEAATKEAFLAKKDDTALVAEEVNFDIQKTPTIGLPKLKDLSVFLKEKNLNALHHCWLIEAHDETHALRFPMQRVVDE